MPTRTSNHTGNVTEIKIAAAAVELGLTVLSPMVEHGRYDLVFDLGSKLLRVQCKSATFRDGVVRIALAGSYLTPDGYVRSTYTADEIDAVAAYCADLDAAYLLPIELIANRRGIYLRVDPAQNAQRAALNWAADYEFSGAVAQLGERLGGTQKATGSSPVSSISPTESSRVEVGANKFRHHFGWYMERAAAGEEIFVTHRGKPYVGLVPADNHQLQVDTVTA